MERGSLVFTSSETRSFAPVVLPTCLGPTTMLSEKGSSEISLNHEGTHFTLALL